MEIKKIFIAGAGTLGARIGLQSAISGFEVTIYDITEKALEDAKILHSKILKSLAKKGIFELDEAKIAKVQNSITWTQDISLVKDADLVSESIIENRDIKIEFWKELGALCKKEAILTTNTSYMLPSWFAEASGNPKRFCAWHFHDVFTARVVDIMFHPNTSDEILQPLKELSLAMNQIPVVLNKEANGYVFNQMLGAILKVAGNIAKNEITSIHDVDRSWMGNFQMPIGPFGMMDEVGLETVSHICKGDKSGDSDNLAAIVQPYLDRNELGVKSGKGFYSYPKPLYKNEGFLDGE